MSQNRSSAVMQRAEAITVGQKWYFTGEPCLHGHIARRWVVNRECHHCVNARRRVRRAIDPAPYRAKEKRRRDRDPAHYSELQRQRRLRHIEKRRAYDRRRYGERPEYRARMKRSAIAWARKNKGKRNKIVAARRWWIKRATPSWLTPEQKAEIAAVYLEASRRGESVDHIYPLRAKNSSCSRTSRRRRLPAEARALLDEAKLIRADGAALVERVNKLAKDATEIGKKLDGLGIICDRVERSLKA